MNGDEKIYKNKEGCYVLANKLYEQGWNPKRHTPFSYPCSLHKNCANKKVNGRCSLAEHQKKKTAK